MISTAEAFTSNKILRALPPQVFGQLKSYLEPVDLEFRQVLHYTDDPVNEIYFPENAVLSNVNVLEDGESLETGIIGNEGMTGFSTVFSQNCSPCETVVQIAGIGWRIKTKDFWRIVEGNRLLPRPIMAFINIYTEQSSQSAVCATHHPLARRMVKRLLMYQDRMPQNSALRMNHESIALMLGVTRASVTVAAKELKNSGLINYSRSNIEIVDRKGLENFSCDCYGAIKQAYDRYLLQIELKDLTERVGRNTQEYFEMIGLRKKIAKETKKSIEEFRRVKNEAIPMLVKICAQCQKVCDLQYNPRVIAENNNRLLQVLSTSGICTSCSATNKN